MIKKQNRLDILIFLISSTLIIFVGIACFIVYDNIMKEREAVKNQAELEKLSFSLLNTSAFLTSEVRKFAVTLDPIHLRNYWTEINVQKTREKVIARLKELKVPTEEFNLLNAAKNNSDDLINTEIRAMKLILLVYEVPENQMEPEIANYQLTNEDEALSFNQKVNEARMILYDNTYEKNKRKILDPIAEFDKKMSKRVASEALTARKNTNFSINILILTVVFVFVYLFFIAWFMLYRISIPIKTYLMNLDDDAIGKDEMKQKNIDFIRQLQSVKLFQVK